MQSEAQQIAIAEACGWKRCMTDLIVKNVKQRGWFKEIGNSVMEVHESRLPDYLNDLNAMHEAEKIIKNSNWYLYSNRLTGVLRRSVGGNKSVTYLKLHATAAQRAEAFLRTIGKWSE